MTKGGTVPLFDVVVVGAGQAGIGLGFHLKKAGLDFVILERDRIGESWRSGRWDSFAVNTPNWMNGLPGSPYRGEDPEGFLTRDELVASFERHVADHTLPIRVGVAVERVHQSPDSNDFVVETVDRDGDVELLTTRNVVVASGIQRTPKIPPVAERLPDSVTQLHASQYRSATGLPDGAVVVIGSAQSGCQIAEDLVEAGRTVFLCTSRVARVPRRYRGRDALDWMVRAGLFDQRVADLPDPRMEFAAQPQISGVGSRGHTVSLQGLAARSVHLMGKLVDVADGVITTDDHLTEHVAFADEFSADFKRSIDDYITTEGIEAPAADVDPLDERATGSLVGETTLDLEAAAVSTVVWCTGFESSFPWLDVPAVFDDEGRPVHDRGVARVPGITFLGFPWLHTRKSGILYGIDEDACHLTEAIVANTSARTMR